MKYAVLADVHANLEALDAVLAAARDLGADRIVCAGDVVGYHADPDACVERLRAASAVCVAGNHDRVAALLAEPVRFGDEARRAVLWTQAHISAESRAFLSKLPLTAVVDGRFLLFHGALHPAPDPDVYLSNHARVSRSIEALRDGPWGVRVAFFGHTHQRAVYEARRGDRRSLEGEMIELSGAARYLINPGSVGQPRDGDPRAAFALFDTDAGTVRFCRVPFDAAACLAKAAREGLVPAARAHVPAVMRLFGLGMAALRRLR